MPQDIPENYIHLAKLGKSFGLKGGLHIYPLGEAEAQALLSLKEVFIPSLGKRVVKQVQQQGKAMVIFIAGIQHIDYAKPLVGQAVYALADALPEAEGGLFYLEDLLGMAVMLNGEAFGEVMDVVEAGAQDLLVISSPTQEGEWLVPLQADYVDITDEAIHIDNPPEGLLEL